MSNSLVKFINIKNFEVDLDRTCKILIEYVVDKDVQVSYNDWIAIYPQGVEVWNTDSLDFIVAYEFRGPMNKGESRCKIELSLKGAKKLDYWQKYQFVYISKHAEIYGISEAFEFRPPVLSCKKETPDKSDSGGESEDASKENSENNSIIVKKTKTYRLTSQPLGKVESTERESREKNSSGGQKKKETKTFINNFKKNKQVFEKKEMETRSNGGSHAVPYAAPPTISCSNCHRVARLLRDQEKLYTQRDKLADIHNDLCNQVAHLQRQLGLTQATRQKLYATLKREQQAKLFYQAAAEYEFQFMVVEPFVPSMLISPRRNLPVSGRPRVEEKTNDGFSILKLKTIIGNQEMKIRGLIKEIEQLKRKEETQKFTTVERNI